MTSKNMQHGGETVQRLTVDPERDLLASTFRWLVTLPETARPKKLAGQFPRIANKLAMLWSEPVVCKKYIVSLVLDDRGDRAGFPPDMLMELAELEAYIDGLTPDLAPGRFPLP